MTLRLITSERWETEPIVTSESRAGIVSRPRVELMGGKAGSPLLRCENEKEEMADERGKEPGGYKIDDVSASVNRNTSIPFVSLSTSTEGRRVGMYT